MSKIKGWTKTENMYNLLWINDYTHTPINISEKKGIYKVFINGKTLGEFQTKKEALDCAITFMKTHPTGYDAYRSYGRYD